jgi:hypothetical protein
MENNLFSICIPTYNRFETFKEMITDLIPKIKKHNVKIYIHDAQPAGEMEIFINSLKKSYPYIVYFKSDKVRTADENMKRALELSDTKYRMLMSDHYILYDESSIDEIYKYLNEDFDALVLHYKNRRMVRDGDFLYTDKNMFIKELGWYIGMAATTVYSDKMVKNANFEKYYNTNFAQSLAVMDYISNRDFKIQYISKETVWNLKNGIKGQKAWQDDVLKIFAKRWYEGVMSLPGYSEEVKLECIVNHDRYTNFYSFKNIVLFRFTGGITLGKLFRYYKYLKYTASKDRIFKMFLISLIPVNLIRFVFKEEYLYIKRVLGNINEYKEILKD